MRHFAVSINAHRLQLDRSTLGAPWPPSLTVLHEMMILSQAVLLPSPPSRLPEPMQMSCMIRIEEEYARWRWLCSQSPCSVASSGPARANLVTVIHLDSWVVFFSFFSHRRSSPQIVRTRSSSGSIPSSLIGTWRVRGGPYIRGKAGRSLEAGCTQGPVQTTRPHGPMGA